MRKISSQVDEPDRRAQQLPLGALAAVEEQALAAPPDEQRARSATRSRRAGRGAEEDDVEVHRRRSYSRPAPPGRARPRRRGPSDQGRTSRSPGMDGRAGEVVRLLDLPDRLAHVAAVVRGRDRPERVVRLNAVDGLLPVRPGRTRRDRPDERGRGRRARRTWRTSVRNATEQMFACQARLAPAFFLFAAFCPRGRLERLRRRPRPDLARAGAARPSDPVADDLGREFRRSIDVVQPALPAGEARSSIRWKMFTTSTFGSQATRSSICRYQLAW